jgi:hypothetical protein
MLTKPLSALTREEEGRALRAMLGMLIKKRTADADILRFSVERCAAFLAANHVGVVIDGDELVVHVQPIPPEQRIEVYEENR